MSKFLPTGEESIIRRSLIGEQIGLFHRPRRINDTNDRLIIGQHREQHTIHASHLLQRRQIDILAKETEHKADILGSMNMKLRAEEYAKYGDKACRMFLRNLLIRQIGCIQRIRLFEGTLQKEEHLFPLQLRKTQLFILHPDFGFRYGFILNEFLTTELATDQRLIEHGLREDAVNILRLRDEQFFTERGKKLQLSIALRHKSVIKLTLFIHQEAGQALVDSQKRSGQQSVLQSLDALEVAAQLNEKSYNQRQEEQHRYP